MDEQPGADNARSEMPTPTIRLESVSKKFLSKSGEEVKALEGITFDVARSEFVSIIGPSGCGKSTVLSLIAGLEKPSEGKVYLDGEDVKGTNPEKISIMFQEHTLFPWRTIQSNVEFGLELKGASRDARSEASRKYLDLVGLAGFENKFPREVSGGMKQRASLARSLALDPEVVLMDEPFGALDEQTRMQLGNELVRIWLETKKTIVGAKQVNLAHIQLARSMGASSIQIYRKVILPSIIPTAFAGMRLSLILVSVTVTLAEMYQGTVTGLGSLIFYWSTIFLSGPLYGVILVFSLVLIAANQALLSFEKRLSRLSE